MAVISDDEFVRPFQTTFGLTNNDFAGNNTVAKLRELPALAGITVPCVPMIASLGAGVASCETQGFAYPPAADQQVRAKPVPPVEVLTSRVAGEKHDNAIEAWSEDGWSQVARLCRFFDGMGMAGLSCPPPAVPPRPG